MAAERYFDMQDDVYVEGRWYLVDPRDANGVALRGMFFKGQPSQVIGPVQLDRSRFAERGKPVDYSEISDQTVPVVHVRVAELFQRLAPEDVQIVPVTVEGAPDQYCIVNVVTVRRCIDEAASREIRKFTEKDRDVFPDRIGEYKRVSELKIDKSKVENAKIFRTWGWVAIIVAEEIKNALEAAHVVGVKFVEV